MAELGCPIAGCGQRVGATESVGAGLQKCAKCRQRVYCCKACQVQHWKDGHKQECKELQMGAGAEAGVLSRPAQDELLAALLETNATGRDLTDSEFRWMDKTSLLFDAGHFSLVKAETEEGLKVLKQIRNDRPDIAVKIYFMLGHSLTESCQHKKGAQLLQKGRALAMKTGDRVDLGQICLSLGACHLRQGEYSEAIEALEQSRAITVERGEPQWEARVCNNLGLCYESMKLYEKATELFEFCLKIHRENDDLLQMGMLRCNLGRCQSQRGWHQRAVCSLKLAWLIMHKLQEPQKQALVALPLGTALWMKTRAEHYQATAGVAAAEWEGASEACRETLADADYWLRLALTKASELGIRTLKLQAQMHLACVTFFRGNAKDAVKMIGQHLNGWCDLGKAICAGCGQARGEKRGEKDFPMLTCAHCRVARYCNAEHQRMAWKGASDMSYGIPHKDICPLLAQWRRMLGSSKKMAPEDLEAMAEVTKECEAMRDRIYEFLKGVAMTPVSWAAEPPPTDSAASAAAGLTELTESAGAASPPPTAEAGSPPESAAAGDD